MTHHWQKIRKQNIEEVKKVLAPLMPNGAPDQVFQAMVIRQKGFSRRFVDEALSVLLATEEIEFDHDTRTWRLPLART